MSSHKTVPKGAKRRIKNLCIGEVTMTEEGANPGAKVSLIKSLDPSDKETYNLIERAVNQHESELAKEKAAMADELDKGAGVDETGEEAVTKSPRKSADAAELNKTRTKVAVLEKTLAAVRKMSSEEHAYTEGMAAEELVEFAEMTSELRKSRMEARPRLDGTYVPASFMKRLAAAEAAEAELAKTKADAELVTKTRAYAEKLDAAVPDREEVAKSLASGNVEGLLATLNALAARVSKSDILTKEIGAAGNGEEASLEVFFEAEAQKLLDKDNTLTKTAAITKAYGLHPDKYRTLRSQAMKTEKTHG